LRGLLRRGCVCCPWGVDRCLGMHPRQHATPTRSCADAPPPPRGRESVTPQWSLGRVGHGQGPGARPPTGWSAVGKAENAGQNLEIYHRDYCRMSFYILNEERRRGGRSAGVIFVGAAWARVCMLHGVRTPMHASPAPPDRLVVIGGVLGTCPASFTAWGARERQLHPQNAVLAVHTCVGI
jgi:hypothetical protein